MAETNLYALRYFIKGQAPDHYSIQEFIEIESITPFFKSLAKFGKGKRTGVFRYQSSEQEQELFLIQGGIVQLEHPTPGREGNPSLIRLLHEEAEGLERLCPLLKLPYDPNKVFKSGGDFGE